MLCPKLVGTCLPAGRSMPTLHALPSNLNHSGGLRPRPSASRPFGPISSGAVVLKRSKSAAASDVRSPHRQAGRRTLPVKCAIFPHVRHELFAHANHYSSRPAAGFEPTTPALQKRRSAVELRWRNRIVMLLLRGSSLGLLSLTATDMTTERAKRTAPSAPNT